MLSYWCEHAWLPDGVRPGVVVTCGDDGAIESVGQRPRPPEAIELRGLVTPGFANVHSHAFQRALRGRTHGGTGSFWTWREAMYALAGALEPDSYRALARAVYAEMALAGVTCVGEFHYVHHRADGRPYEDPNAMADALRSAARDAGIRLTLLDACYLAGGPDEPLEPGQQRFSDGDAEAWTERFRALEDDAGTRIGAAVHSVRAVPAADIPVVVAAAAGRPLHVHLSEQPAENEACRAAYGVTPAQLLADRGALTTATTVVHATHLTDADIALLGGARVQACLCPTTERDLGDGIGPARRLADAGARLCLGSDQHVVIDPIEEARALEMDERLASGRRGRFTVPELVDALTRHGHAALGWAKAGMLAPGWICDLVAVRLDTPRTAGAAPEQALLAAVAADVSDVVVGGRRVVSGGEHVLGDVGDLLGEAIGALTRTVVIDVLPAVDVMAGRLAWSPGGASTDPLRVALAWQEQGARWVHLVDLDRAYGRGENAAVLTAIAQRLDVAVELSGGIADDATLEAALATSAERIVLATAALERPDWVRAAVARSPERIAVGLDVRDDRLVPRGSDQDLGALFEVLERLDRDGCRCYVVTDVHRDGALAGPGLELLRSVCAATAVPVVASGGTATLDDVRRVTEIPGVCGLIVGRALYAGAFTLAQALGAADADAVSTG